MGSTQLCEPLAALRLWERLSEDPATTAIVVSLAGSVPFVAAMGNGGLGSVKDALHDTEVQLVALKVYGVLEEANGVCSKRAKYVLLTWSGERVSRMAKAAAMPLKSALAAYFRGHHAHLEAFDKDAISAREIEAKLRTGVGESRVQRACPPCLAHARACASCLRARAHTQPARCARTPPPPPRTIRPRRRRLQGGPLRVRQRGVTAGAVHAGAPARAVGQGRRRGC